MGEKMSRRIKPAAMPRRSRQFAFLSMVVPGLVLVAIAAVIAGSTHVGVETSLRVIGSKIFPWWIKADDVPEADAVIIWLIRVPRVMVAASVGAGLAMAGAMIQGLFRNPLAEPNLVGVGAGSALGVSGGGL